MPSLRIQACLCLNAIALALTVQLFVPPIVGLSDNGDFPREIGVFGYAPQQRTPPVRWSYVAPLYLHQQIPGDREPAYEQFTSDFIFVILAIVLGQGTLPITLLGAIHSLAFLGALARLFQVTSKFKNHLLLWISTAIVVTDVGYVAYHNALFAEAASGIFAVWLIAEAIEASKQKKVSWMLLVASALLITAKPQDAPLAIPLSIFLVAIGPCGKPVLRFAGPAFLAIAAVAMIASVKPLPKRDIKYNMLFSAVLPESRDPRGDLRALGLDPELVALKGKLAFSPESRISDPAVESALKTLGPFTITAFYVRRPTRLWRHISTLFPVATQLRPESCGNFELSAGKPPAARSTSFSFWSTVHERYLGRVTKFLLFGLGAMLIAGIVLRQPVIALVPALALTAFFTAAFGDASEPIKHQYLFNLLLDASLLASTLLIFPKIIESLPFSNP